MSEADAQVQKDVEAVEKTATTDAQKIQTDVTGEIKEVAKTAVETKDVSKTGDAVKKIVTDTTTEVKKDGAEVGKQAVDVTKKHGTAAVKVEANKIAGGEKKNTEASTAAATTDAKKDEPKKEKKSFLKKLFSFLK